MRTADPQIVKSDFLSSLDEVEGALAAGAQNRPARDSDNKLAEFSFLAISVLLEGFVGDLIVAAINKQPGRFINELVNGMEIITTNPMASSASEFFKIKLNRHLTLEQVRKIIDPNGRNVTFIDMNKLKECAGKWLEEPFKSAISRLSKSDSATIDATTAIRNYLAHRSKSASDKMQVALEHPDLPSQLLRGKHKKLDVGYYLTAVPSGLQQRRIEYFVAQFRRIANHTCP